MTRAEHGTERNNGLTPFKKSQPFNPNLPILTPKIVDAVLYNFPPVPESLTPQERLVNYNERLNDLNEIRKNLATSDTIYYFAAGGIGDQIEDALDAKRAANLLGKNIVCIVRPEVEAALQDAQDEHVTYQSTLPQLFDNGGNFRDGIFLMTTSPGATTIAGALVKQNMAGTAKIFTGDPKHPQYAEAIRGKIFDQAVAYGNYMGGLRAALKTIGGNALERYSDTSARRALLFSMLLGDQLYQHGVVRPEYSNTTLFDYKKNRLPPIESTLFIAPDAFEVEHPSPGKNKRSVKSLSVEQWTQVFSSLPDVSANPQTLTLAIGRDHAAYCLEVLQSARILESKGWTIKVFDGRTQNLHAYKNAVAASAAYVGMDSGPTWLATEVARAAKNAGRKIKLIEVFNERAMESNEYLIQGNPATTTALIAPNRNGATGETPNERTMDDMDVTYIVESIREAVHI